MPQNPTDAVTMLHDIDYLRFSGQPALVDSSDRRAISNSKFDLAGLATKVGLNARLVTQLDFAKPLLGISHEETRLIGQELFNIVRSDPQYRQLFRQWNIRII